VQALFASKVEIVRIRQLPRFSFSMSAIKMKPKIVRYTLETLPPITEEQRQRIAALAAMPDSEIDTSDIPEWTAEQWKQAIRGGRPAKKQVVVWLDADVVSWLKSQGDGYQTRMNAILRREMLAAVRAGK
jgi:uncharacterized protein (DUF4415 family)